MIARRTCQFCRQPFDADVNEEGWGQEVCGPCDANFAAQMDSDIAVFIEEKVAAALNRVAQARRLSESVLSTIDSLDVA